MCAAPAASAGFVDRLGLESRGTVPPLSAPSLPLSRWSMERFFRGPFDCLFVSSLSRGEAFIFTTKREQWQRKILTPQGQQLLCPAGAVVSPESQLARSEQDRMAGQVPRRASHISGESAMS